MPVIDALPSVLGAAAVVPAIIYLMSLALLDQRREPPIVVVLSFLLGACSIFALALFHIGLDPLLDIDVPDPVWALFQSFGGIAAPEEAVKVLILMGFAQRYIAFRHPMEGVVYGAAVGLGFAAYENLGLLVTQPEAWRQHMVVRSVVTVPVHAALGIVAGIYVARAHAHWHASTASMRAWKEYLWAWLVPTALHGLYDYPLLLSRLGVTYPRLAITTLRSAGFVLGLVAITFCARRLYRIAAAQGAARGPFGAGWPAGYRAWRLHIIGGLASFTGALMVLIEVHDFLRGEPFAFDRHIFVTAGSVLLAAATLAHRRAIQHHRLAPARGHAERSIHLH